MEECEICGAKISIKEYERNGGCCDDCYYDLHPEFDIEEW